jgi:hypothetical protein
MVQALHELGGEEEGAVEHPEEKGAPAGIALLKLGGHTVDGGMQVGRRDVGHELLVVQADACGGGRLGHAVGAAEGMRR